MTKSKKWSEPHATKRQLRYFVKEEQDTSKLYDSLGFHKQAVQEKAHAKFFKSQIKKQKKASSTVGGKSPITKKFGRNRRTSRDPWTGKEISEY